MKRLVYTFILLVSFSFTAKAIHITGGEMYYVFKGSANGEYQYTVTLKLFQRCGSGRQFPNPTIISIFDRGNNSRVRDFSVNITNNETISITDPDPCINNPPQVCYDVAYYTFDISLPMSSGGYVIASQVNFRISGINNLMPGYSNVGATYAAEIPGYGSNGTAPQNNSAVFTGSDLVIVCANNDFTYSFGAQDPDGGDELRYSFCQAYASTSSGGMAVPVNPPPFPSVPYEGGSFTADLPLGAGITINPATGLITGIAPSIGTYVVTVCVQEVKNGVVVATQRKDLQISIADCDVASASLEPEYQLCKNTMTIDIANKSISPLIVTSDWEFMDNTNAIIHTASGTAISYTFASIGLYTVKLIINRNLPCSDSATAVIRVFPGFVPDFTSTGICITKPTLFRDASTSVYGVPNSWKWDFGEASVNTDISPVQHPSYTYPLTGAKQAQLIVTDTRGCRDTIIKTVTIIDKPPISLAFKDTLICKNDILPLSATGPGLFSWTPLINITNPGTGTPTVAPLTTTTYYLKLDIDGCINTDSVKVNVVDFVTVRAMNDTIICRTDTIQLRLISDGLHFSWTPSAEIIDPSVKSPLVHPSGAVTSFHVIATIGGCTATEDIVVSTVPYPVAYAGEDFAICYNTSGQLKGSTDGSSWQWTPVNLVNNSLLLNPITYPPRTSSYVLTASDTKGCPKTSRDTVVVTVYPKMFISAGRDTSVVVGQPLQLNATGGIRYIWSPSESLSAIDLPNPVALFPNFVEDIRYKVIGYSDKGCPDSAFINVKIFKTKPTIFIPTAFTPNNDGKNDLLRPIAIGIRSIDYFSIYNRWGQLVFTTRTNGHGWDGKINGTPQATGSFIWVVKAVDYTGASYFEKGMSTLIR